MNAELLHEPKNEPVTVHLNIETRFFIGKKPTKLFIGSDEIPVYSWWNVIHVLLGKCSIEKHKELFDIRNKIVGTKRIILSDTNAGMEKPIKIDENLYFEAHFGTDKLLLMLFRIFDTIGYEYKDFLVTVKNRQPSKQNDK